jgi:predicted transcriptional regulator of viral defense system
MKTRQWQNLLTEQSQQGKTLFTLTELANTAGVPRSRVNVEMTRLVKYGVLARHAKGIYSLAGYAVPPEQLLARVDPHAYITGAYALLQHGVITQVPTVITCFTTRRHFNREMQTAVGRIEFVCVKPPIYRREVRAVAGPELALYDFVYIALRRGMSPERLVTFRLLNDLKRSVLIRTGNRYPSTVRRQVSAIVEMSR